MKVRRGALRPDEIAFACQASHSFVALAFGDVTVALAFGDVTVALAFGDVTVALAFGDATSTSAARWAGSGSR
jgi:hypothetical protein